jgi:WD40 repeat protein/ABC-type cobalamin/Fe3+-siderophores transport system ATPase subunit
MIKKLCEFVTENSLTVVLGLSGSGKSSLVKAGLIPALESVDGNQQNSQQQWQILKPIRPEDAPFSALNIALTEQNLPKVAKPGEAVGQGTLAESLEAWRQRHPGSKLLLVIDQSEELITLCRDDREREGFLRSLTEALASENLSDQLRIVLTLRSDFEPQIRDAIEHTHWQEAWQDGRFVVTQMNRQELQEAIEEPAAARALFFESPRLINQLIDEVIQMPGALPLLSFTLSELYLMYLKAEEKEERSDRTITEADYKTLGGVTLSLTKRADQEYKALVDEDPAYERTIRNITLRMVAMSRGELARRQVPLSELEYPEPEENNRVEEVRRRFLEARLTVEGLDASGNKYVEPAHDELVRGWTKLRNWIDKAPESLSLQQRLTLTAAANDWKEKEQANYLWNSNPYLALLEKVVNSNNSWLNQLETDFVKSSIHKRDEELIETEKQIISVFSSNSKDFLASDQHLEAIVEAVKAGKKLKQLQNKYSFWTDAALSAQVKGTLSQVVYGMRECNRWLGHSDGVNSVSFIRNGQMLASASGGGTIKLWSLDGKELDQLLVNIYIDNISFSPDGQMVALGSRSGTIQLWNLDSKELTTLNGHSKWVNSVSFSPDGQMLASAGGDGTIKLWSWDGKELKTFNGHRDTVASISFNPDGQILASAGGDGTIKLWSLDGKELRTLNGHSDWVTSISFSPDGQMLASAGGDGTIKLWSRNGKELRTLNGHSGEVKRVSFSPDGQMLASASRDGTIKLWSLNGKELGTLNGHSNWVDSVSFSPDGQMLASASYDQTIRLWSLNRNQLRKLPHSNGVTSVSFSRDGQMVASGSRDGTIKLWSLDGKELRTLNGSIKEVTSISFSPDGQMVASGSRDDTIKLWSLDGKELGTFKCHSEYSHGVNSVSFSPDGQMLASAVYGGTTFWDLNGNQIVTLQGHGAPVANISFSPDGQMLASAGFDNKINLWKLNNIDSLNVEEPWKELPGHIKEVNSVSFSPDGQRLASAGLDKIINIWSMDGNKIAKLTGHTDGVTSVSFSSDGQMLVSASKDQTIKLWNWDGKVIGTLKAHSDAVNSVSFSPDGMMLASASDDGTVLLWNLDLDDLLAFGCNLVRDLELQKRM